MSNNEKYKKSFVDSLGVEEKLIKEELKYNEIPEWDSIGHMTLIASLEELFAT